MCRFRGVFRSGLLLVVVLLIAGCSQRPSIHGSVPASNEAKVIENVPFVKQKGKFCGPAAMASVMRFYGQNISQEEIAKEVYTPKLGGALISDMEYFAREMGYKAETKNGDLKAIISIINEGIPTILIVDLGKWVVSVPHYYVVYGYNKSSSTFLLHSGFKGDQEMSFSELDKEWEKMNRLMLVVRK
ncbi:MAG: C39 family peptidase [Deltaproteobacteria bacterium]|nr:C39 family peptidase [Deltaproteobacteria bacterium]